MKRESAILQGYNKYAIYVDEFDEGDEMHNGCVVLLSGGQDSTTCALLAREQYGPDNVWPICFQYDQKHKVEVGQAKFIARHLGIRTPMVLDIPALRQLGGGALTNDEIQIASIATVASGNAYAKDHNLPSTVVPGRNVVFLALAAGYGAKLGIYELWTGGCLADYEGYPDCRPEFYAAMTDALMRALDDNRVDIVTPLTHKSKGETFKIAYDLGEIDLVINHTHTCYNGVRDKHEWGAGCGDCPACETRELGYHEFVEIQDSEVLPNQI
jgi:7-cyano-7-deazaguanine synthase